MQLFKHEEEISVQEVEGPGRARIVFEIKPTSNYDGVLRVTVSSYSKKMKLFDPL